MVIVSSRFETDAAGRYLQQLCKHFAHKVTASWNDSSGEVAFAPGSCAMRAEPDALDFLCHAETADDAQKLITIIEMHLIRFAWRDHVELNWVDESGIPVAKSDELITALAEERAKFADKRAH